MNEFDVTAFDALREAIEREVRPGKWKVATRPFLKMIQSCADNARVDRYGNIKDTKDWTITLAGGVLKLSAPAIEIDLWLADPDGMVTQEGRHRLKISQVPIRGWLRRLDSPFSTKRSPRAASCPSPRAQ